MILKDQNLLLIKNIAEEIIPGCRVFLFGSRSRGDFNSGSDYDILVITKNNYSIPEKRSLSSLIRKKLAEQNIDSDVIVKTESDILYYQDKIGSIAKNTLSEGYFL